MDLSSNHKFHEGDKRACSAIVFTIYTKTSLRSLHVLCTEHTHWRGHQASVGAAGIPVEVEGPPPSQLLSLTVSGKDSAEGNRGGQGGGTMHPKLTSSLCPASSSDARPEDSFPSPMVTARKPDQAIWGQNQAPSASRRRLRS